MADHFHEYANQFWQRLTTYWQRSTTLHRSFVLSGLVIVLSWVTSLPGLLTTYFLSILGALAIAKVLNDSSSFQSSDFLLKYIYLMCHFYQQFLSALQWYYTDERRNISTSESRKNYEDVETNDLRKDADDELHFESRRQTQLNVTKIPKDDRPAKCHNHLYSIPQDEAHLLRFHIWEDFIISWFTLMSPHRQVPNDFLIHLEELSAVFSNHLRRLDLPNTVFRILIELRKHISHFRTSSFKLKHLPLNSRSTVTDVYEHLFELHPAIQDRRTMEEYLRQVTDVLMWFFLPKELYRCYTGKLLLQEILFCNVFISLVDLLSDPNTLNDIILLLFVTAAQNHPRPDALISSKDNCLEKVQNISSKCRVTNSNNTNSNVSIFPKKILSCQLETERNCNDYNNDTGVMHINSDDHKLCQASSKLKRPVSLDLYDATNPLSQSLPNKPVSPQPPLFRCKSSPDITVQANIQTIDHNRDFTMQQEIPISGLIPSPPLQPMPSLTSLVSFRSIPADEEDAELWFIDGENDDTNDGFIIPSHASCISAELAGNDSQSNEMNRQMVPYSKHDHGFASDTFKMLHGMVGNALSKLPSMDANFAEDKEEEDGVDTNFVESKVSDEFQEEKCQPPRQQGVKSLQDILAPGSEHSNWGHDFLSHHERKSSSLTTQNKDIRNHKDNTVHRTASLIVDDPRTKLVKKSATEKRSVFSLSHSKTLAVMEGMTEGSHNDVKERNVWIQSMLIVATETMKDQRNINKDYTLYHIKYQALIWQGDEHPTEPETCLLKRRFREFRNLQSRLEENPELKPLLKGIKDVPRKMQLVIRMNEDVVSQRKQSLERYLQSLCIIPAVCSSIEFQEFIALGGDKHIEYVKKAPEIVPRIDKESYINELEKFFIRGMSGLMGTLKSKLPSSSPQAISPAPSRIEQLDSYQNGDSRQDVEMPPSPFAEVEIEDPQRSYAFRTRDGTVETNVDVVMKAFLESTRETMCTDKESLERDDPLQPPRHHQLEEQSNFVIEDGKKDLNYGEIPLADAIMCLSCEILQGYGNWLIKETTQQIMAVAFGKLINRVLEDTVSRLSTQDMISHYLMLIRQSLWPNGKLLSRQSAPITDEEKQLAKKKAWQILKDSTPGIVQVIVGEEEIDSCLHLVHASLQDPHLNSHLVFTLIDILLDALVPEIHDPNVCQRLLQQLATEGDNAVQQ